MPAGIAGGAAGVISMMEEETGAALGLQAGVTSAGGAGEDKTAGCCGKGIPSLWA
jgi:hypothetical protein